MLAHLKLVFTCLLSVILQGGCAGTLIADNWVVTAASCLIEPYDNENECLPEFDQKKCPGDEQIQCQV